MLAVRQMPAGAGKPVARRAMPPASRRVDQLYYLPVVEVPQPTFPNRGDHVGKLTMTPELVALVAERFKALAEPARLHMLNVLRTGEMTVGELVEETGLGQANVSKHLQMLYSLAFVSRRKEGLFVYYALADRTVFKLCDLMCGQLEAEMKTRRKLLAV
jgi:DNA-binding transcriptional ArsR family regulator